MCAIVTIETSGFLGPQSHAHYAVHQGLELLHPAGDQRANLMHTSISHPGITFTCGTVVECICHPGINGAGSEMQGPQRLLSC